MDISTTVIASTVLGAGATLAVRQIWDRWKAPDEVRRRVEDRFVQKETCTKCEQGLINTTMDLRGFIRGVDAKVDRVAAVTENNGNLLIKIAGKLGVG